MSDLSQIRPAVRCANGAQFRPARGRRAGARRTPILLSGPVGHFVPRRAALPPGPSNLNPRVVRSRPLPGQMSGSLANRCEPTHPFSNATLDEPRERRYWLGPGHCACCLLLVHPFGGASGFRICDLAGVAFAIDDHLDHGKSSPGIDRASPRPFTMTSGPINSDTTGGPGHLARATGPLLAGLRPTEVDRSGPWSPWRAGQGTGCSWWAFRPRLAVLEVQQARASRCETAGVEIERSQVVLEIDMQPLAPAALASCSDTTTRAVPTPRRWWARATAVSRTKAWLAPSTRRLQNRPARRPSEHRPTRGCGARAVPPSRAPEHGRGQSLRHAMLRPRRWQTLPATDRRWARSHIARSLHLTAIAGSRPTGRPCHSGGHGAQAFRRQAFQRGTRRPAKRASTWRPGGHPRTLTPNVGTRTDDGNPSLGELPTAFVAPVRTSVPVWPLHRLLAHLGWVSGDR